MTQDQIICLAFFTTLKMHLALNPALFQLLCCGALTTWVTLDRRLCYHVAGIRGSVIIISPPQVHCTGASCTSSSRVGFSDAMQCDTAQLPRRDTQNRMHRQVVKQILDRCRGKLSRSQSKLLWGKRGGRSLNGWRWKLPLWSVPLQGHVRQKVSAEALRCSASPHSTPPVGLTITLMDVLRKRCHGWCINHCVYVCSCLQTQMISTSSLLNLTKPPFQQYAFSQSHAH